jgi:hypothetical protein
MRTEDTSGKLSVHGTKGRTDRRNRSNSFTAHFQSPIPQHDFRSTAHTRPLVS